MKVAIASGKGGTGKTMLTVNLAHTIEGGVVLLDCDVEEPNVHLFLPGKQLGEEVISTPLPSFDEELCDGCGICGDFCAFNAIAVLGNRPLLFPELCHGCGGCTMVCPKGAIKEVRHRIGVVEMTVAGDITVIGGCLDIGIAMVPPLIRAVRARVINGITTIIDAPPGTSCPVIAAIHDTDFVILVTEPTPFGLHDLKLAVGMVRAMHLRFGVVVNKMGVGDENVHIFCRDEHIPIFAEIPYDMSIAEAYSRGELITNTLPEYETLFRELIKKVREAIDNAHL